MKTRQTGKKQILSKNGYTASMFFPLGLGFKTKTFPIVTWLLILMCIFYYAVLQQKDRYNREYIVLEEHLELERAHDHLFYEYCQQRLESGLCERFALERGLYFERQEDIPFFTHDHDTSPKAIMEFMRLYEEFSQKLEDNPRELNSLPAYELYSSSLTGLEQETQKIRKRYDLLHHDNMSLSSLLSAVFSHENLAHLLGNMLFLFIFGRYVEARVGHTAYLLSYALLGTLALAIYAWFDNRPFLHILGASANVSVVMGAFYALFFHHKLKIFFFYIAYKVAEFPVKTYMFFFFMLQEFVFSLTGSGNVAYTAHAIGLVFGMGFGFVWSKTRPLPRDFLYEDELAFWNEAKLETIKSKFVDKAVEILKYNPNNKTVISAVVKEIAPEEIDFAGLDLDEELLLRELIPGHLHDLWEKGQCQNLFKTLEQIPHSWSMSVCLRSFSQKELLELIDTAIDNNRLMASVLLIQAFAERYRRSPKLYNLLKTLRSVLNHMPLTLACRKHLGKIKDLSSSEGIRVVINARLAEER